MILDPTWNFLLTVLGGLLFPIIILMLTKMNRDAETRYAGLNAKMDIIGQTMLNVQLDLEQKIARKEHDENCHQRSDDIWERLNNHCHDSSGNVVIPRMPVQR